MYLHLGMDKVVRQKDIIAILDMENTTISAISREFLATAQDEGFIISLSNEIPKSYIITEENKKSKIYVSPISTATILKRLKNLSLEK